MATRRERVVLDLEDNLSGGMVRAAAATGLLKHELNDLSGHSVRTSRDLDSQSRSIDKVGSSTQRSGPAIDKYSGRLRVLADAAITLGPALIPLGAATIPVLTAALAGLGAAAGGVGVTVLALHGIGDGLKALDKYQAESTATNLHALRLEMEKLGPAGMEFVRFIDGLEPQLKALQNVARAGLFPGVEVGIDYMLNRLPEVTKIVNRLSQGMGDLAHDAGAAIGGPQFDAFFKYLETDARPTLEAFGHAAGNVAVGVANMLVAFAPLSRDFTAGLEKASKAFADWSTGLGDNQGFQDFLSYVRESGPQVAALLGALAEAVVGLIHAAAPMGRAVVPALTAVARAFSAIADSPIGPPLYTAIAALVAFNRVSSLTGKAATSLSNSWKKLGTDTGTMSSKISVLAGRGGVILAAGVAVGQLADSIDRIDTSKVASSLDALQFGDVTPTIDKVVSSLENLNSWTNKGPDFGEIFTAGGLFGDDTRDKMQSNVDAIDKSLAQMVESGNAVEASGLFKKITDLASAKGIDPSDTAKSFDDYSQAVKNAAAATEAAAGSSSGYRTVLEGVGRGLHSAANGATDLTGALANLNGWFDKRQAIRDYRDAIQQLAKGLKNGFGPKDVDHLDAAGKAILQVAQTIKDPKIQADFLAGARASLANLADKSGPKAEAAIQRVINKLDSDGLTHPVLVPLKVDDKATPTLDQLGIHLRRTGDTHVKPTVDVDPGNSLGILGQLSNMLGNLHDRTIHVTTLRTGSSSVEPHASIPKAMGGTVPGRRLPYGDKVLIHAAPGEELITNRHGEADQFRRDRALGLIPGYADGGLVANTYTRRQPSAGLYADGGPFHAINNLAHAANDAATGLKGLKAQLAAEQKAYDKAKQTRDDAVSRRDSLSSTIQSGLMGDSIFAASSGSVWASGAHGANDPQAAVAALNARTDRAQRFVAALNKLKADGVTGAALQAILSEGLEATEAMAAADLGTLSQFATAVNDSSTTLAAAGLAGGNAVEGDNVKAANQRLDKLHDDLKNIQQAINQANVDNKDAHQQSTQQFTLAVNGSASSGHRHGKGGH